MLVSDWNKSFPKKTAQLSASLANMIRRRNFLPLLAGAAVSAGALPVILAAPSIARSQPLRGTLTPADDKSLTKSSVASSVDLGKAIGRAAREGRTLVLEPGDYIVADVDLPDGARITGAPGATRLIYKGGGRFLRAAGRGRIELRGLIIDGAGLPLSAETPALVHARAVEALTIDNCQFQNAAGSAIQLEACSARITATPSDARATTHSTPSTEPQASPRQ